MVLLIRRHEWHVVHPGVSRGEVFWALDPLSQEIFEQSVCHRGGPPERDTRRSRYRFTYTDRLIELEFLCLLVCRWKRDIRYSLCYLGSGCWFDRLESGSGESRHQGTWSQPEHVNYRWWDFHGRLSFSSLLCSGYRSQSSTYKSL